MYRIESVTHDFVTNLVTVFVSFIHNEIKYNVSTSFENIEVCPIEDITETGNFKNEIEGLINTFISKLN